MNQQPGRVHRPLSCDGPKGRARRLFAALPLSLAGAIAPVWAADQPPDGAGAAPAAPAPAAPTVTLPPTDIVRSRIDLLGDAATASQGTITQEELNLRPIFRIGQLLE